MGRLETLGDFGLFARATLRRLPGVRRHLAEALHQARVMTAGSVGLVAFLSLVIGGQAALFGTYFLKAIGAQGYIGLLTALADSQVVVALMFGYVFAAKVGCGMVAEIGAMRINDELDALETQGVDPLRYVVGTRLVAALLFMPIVFPIGAAAANLGSYLMAVGLLDSTSRGTFNATHWALQDPINYVWTFVILVTIGVSIVLTATWYGYRVRGGAVEVGEATSRSMVANLVLVHVLVGSMTAFFFGTHPNLPIGG